MKSKIPVFLLAKNTSALSHYKGGSAHLSFIDKSIKRIAGIIKTGFIQMETASRDDIFQRLDARVKLLFMVYFLIIISLKKDIHAELLISVFIFILAVISKINIINFYRNTLLFGFLFGFLIALPSSLNLITGGEIILPLFKLERPYSFWIYSIPSNIGITREGISGVIILTLRVVNSISVSFLVLYTTQFSEIIRACKIFKAPDAFLMIIIISYKYIFIFAKTVEDVYLAMRSRIAGAVSSRDMQNLVAGRMAFMFRKSRIQCEEVYKAMVSRGFTDEIRLYNFKRLLVRDWCAGAVILAAGLIILLV
jgi:cobalt/nickel transport system permease protein